MFMVSAKIATPELKIKVLWKKGYDVITYVYDATNEFYCVTQIILYIWLCDQSLVTLYFLREKL